MAKREYNWKRAHLKPEDLKLLQNITELTHTKEYVILGAILDYALKGFKSGWLRLEFNPHTGRIEVKQN